MDILQSLLNPAHHHAADSLADWWTATASRRAFPTTIDRAIAGGGCADRIGFAFACGYAAALQALLPDAPPDSISALCATEDGGNHPRAIQTRLERTADGYELTGSKKWATLASAAQHLLVVASTGVVDGRPVLRVVRVPVSAPGVHVEASAAPFVPEIPHARITFDHVRDVEVLPGDGYDDYLKPFRTVEDVHVHGALLGYLAGIARRHELPHELIERVLALIVTARALAAADVRAETTHLALAGLIALTTERVTELEKLWQPGAERARWDRDRALLQVAGTARAARRERAWTRSTRA